MTLHEPKVSQHTRPSPEASEEEDVVLTDEAQEESINECSPSHTTSVKSLQKREQETIEEAKESGLWEDDDLSLTDATTVKGEPWSKLKAVAMKPGFSQSF